MAASPNHREIPASPVSDPLAVEPLFNWRNIALVVTAGLVCLYLLSVLFFGQSVPDIGLTCIFSRDVLRSNPGHFPDNPIKLGSKQYQVVQIADQPIHTWPDFLRALRDLPAEATEVASAAATPADVRHRILDGEEQVLVLLQSAASQEQAALWTRVDRSASESLLPSVLWFALKGGLFLVSLVVIWKRPHDRSAAQFFFLSIVTVGAFMGGYHWWRIIPWAPLILVFMISGVLLSPVNLHFYLLFPRPKQFLQRYPIGTLVAVYAVPSFYLLMILIGYFRVRSLVDGGGSVAEVEGALQSVLGWTLLYLPLAGVWYVASVVGLVHSFWTASDGTERNQVKCILFGSVLALMPISYVIYLAVFDVDRIGSGGATWPMFVASCCFTAAYAVSITRYRLMQLDQILNSGAVYLLISFLAALVYYAVVFVVTLFIGRGFGTPSLLANAMIVSTTALVLTFGFDLARSRFKKVLDRRFRKEKYQLDRTLQQMGQALEQLVDPPTLAKRLLHTSAELLGVTRGAVYLREGEPPLFRLADALGEAPALLELAPGCPLVDRLDRKPLLTVRPEPWNAGDPAQGQLRFLGGEVAQALTHEGQTLALLVLGPKEGGAFTPEDFNLLAAFTQMTALALENAARHRTIEGLNRDLQGKVEKISEQQRRIMTLQNQLVKADTRPAGDAPAEDLSMTPRGLALDGVIIGAGPSARQLMQLVRKVAQSQSAVLLRGESGTGKGLLAQALHDHSPRAAKAFVKVHCVALSQGLLESELFGHVKGAFTGAHRDKVGRFELANGGTLFLDEIGDISLEVQTKLLRVLQEMTFERVGSSEPIQVDVRIIAATHQNLEQLIQQGRFRQDLYYRLNVISIPVPPLRERVEDIPELALHFLRLYAQRANRAVTSIDDDALAALKGFGWPGNIRQLENIIERAVVVAEGPMITLHELGPDLQPAGEVLAAAALRSRPIPPGRFRREEREQREKEQLVRALAAASGNKAEAAREPGLARSTLLSKLKKFGLS